MTNIARTMPTGGTILEVSPHPDDEIIGAGATAIELRKYGYRVINLACSLGRPSEHERRRAELGDACARAGIELIVPEKPALISSKDDLNVAQDFVSRLVDKAYTKYDPCVVIAPSVHDGHHGHEVVARATRDTLARKENSRLWMWNIWGGLPHPNIYSPFDDDTLGKVIYALGAYEGENARNDYRRMVVGRALLGAVLGTETVFGFGSASASELPNAGLFTEVVRLNGEWREGQRRVLDDSNVCVAPLENAKSLEAWMNSPSPQQMYRDQQ